MANRGTCVLLCTVTERAGENPSLWSCSGLEADALQPCLVVLVTAHPLPVAKHVEVDPPGQALATHLPLHIACRVNPAVTIGKETWEGA